MGQLSTSFGAIGCVEAGAGDATPIVFLHGVGSDKNVWQPQLDHFGSCRRAIALDYPGYGESDTVGEATRDDYAAAILCAMDACGVDAAHVCGLSLGGVVAIAMHHAAPSRCASLIIADSFSAHPDGRAIYDRSIAASETMTMRALAEARTGMLLGSAATAALRTQVIETMAAIDPDSYRLGAAAVWLADQRDRVTQIDVPTLVICGAEDQITPPALSTDLADRIVGSRLEIIDAAGHLANVEQPAAFNAAIDRFLGAVETGR